MTRIILKNARNKAIISVFYINLVNINGKYLYTNKKEHVLKMRNLYKKKQ